MFIYIYIYLLYIFIYRILLLLHGEKVSWFSWIIYKPRNFFRETFKMALLNHFKFKEKNAIGRPLPDPQGQLSKEINSATIKELNKEVESVVNSGAMCKRSSYLKVTAEQKATLGKYAAEHGIVNAMCHFSPDFPEGALKVSMVRGWKKAY